MNDWLEFFNAYRAPVQHAASLLLAAAAWRWGGSPERWLAGSFLATMVLPVYIVRWLDLGYLSVGSYTSAYLALDVVAAVLFMAVALNANRNYPLWIAGFQVVAVVTHLVNALVGNVSPLAYAFLVIGPSYCQIALLGAGFARHALRERRYGPYREWRLGALGLQGVGL